MDLNKLDAKEKQFEDILARMQLPGFYNSAEAKDCL
jgi:hypothetical protein